MFIWAVQEPRRLGAEALAAIEDPRNDVLLSAVSPWEIAIKAALGRLVFEGDLDTQTRRFGFTELPVRFAHSQVLRSLPPLHGDPFDRMLVAQAQHERLTLVTRDQQVRAYAVATLPA